MTPKEFEANLKALPVEEPDAVDRAMLAEAEELDDGTTVSLEEFRRELSQP